MTRTCEPACRTAHARAANVPLTRVSADPFTNPTSQHATEVEPDTYAFGSTVVAAVQVGRFFDGGATWGAPGFVPGLTFSAGAASPFERVSDASVAYDARHATWMISSIPLLPSLTMPTVFVSLSTDGAATFPTTVQIPPTAKKVDLDNNWTACDNHPASPFYGNCYTEFDSFGEGDLEYMSTSRDGGRTWSVPVSPQGKPKGLGGQPVVRPDGTVVVPFESLKGTISAFRSTDGGASWSRETMISRILAGDLRTSPLPSAEIDAAGRTYVAWEDCRFQTRCSANDIVLSSSPDGVNWSAVSRIPIDAVGSGADHFIPGLAVDAARTGRLALTYYAYRNAVCTEATCQMDVGFISSPDGGAHWGAPTTLAGPMSLLDIADTSQGPMVGDYISTSFNAAGTAATVFAIGMPHTGSVFDEAMWAPRAPLPVTAAATREATTAGAANGQGVGEEQKAVRGD